MKEQLGYRSGGASGGGQNTIATAEEKLRHLQQLLQSFDLSDLSEADRRAMQARLYLYQGSSKQMARA